MRLLDADEGAMLFSLTQLDALSAWPVLFPLMTGSEGVLLAPQYV